MNVEKHEKYIYVCMLHPLYSVTNECAPQLSIAELRSRNCASVQALFHPLYSVTNIRQYKKSICNQFSYFENMQVEWSHWSHGTPTANQHLCGSGEETGCRGGQNHDACYVDALVGEKAHLRMKRLWAVKESSL